MDNAFFEALNSLGSENGLDTDTLIEKVKSAMLKAARKAYPDSEDRITVEIDPTTKTFEMYLRQDVIDDELIAFVESRLKQRKVKGFKIDSIDIQLICHPTRRRSVKR